jgi:hypothetical protein
MTGDQQDMVLRLRRTLPRGWFADTAPMLDAVLGGFASGLSFFYSLLGGLRAQLRIKSASGGMLDLMAADFLGTTLLRGDNEPDASFRLRFLVQVFRERATRRALRSILKEMTGHEPLIIEPARVSDCGALGCTLALGQNGCVGSQLMPWQVFVTVYRPAGIGVMNVSGLADPGCGLGTAAVLVAESSLISLSDQNVYAAIAAVKPIGTTIWARLVDA